jgi:hypothetical protein
LSWIKTSSKSIKHFIFLCLLCTVERNNVYRITANKITVYNLMHHRPWHKNTTTKHVLTRKVYTRLTTRSTACHEHEMAFLNLVVTNFYTKRDHEAFCCTYVRQENGNSSSNRTCWPRTVHWIGAHPSKLIHPVHTHIHPRVEPCLAMSPAHRPCCGKQQAAALCFNEGKRGAPNTKTESNVSRHNNITHWLAI